MRKRNKSCLESTFISGFKIEPMANLTRAYLQSTLVITHLLFVLIMQLGR
uniref:Uncharacterized protein n=1 Tax=Triticum urartu TaxID=4572 RepID=A0A8R7PX39_TRIUA